MTPEQLREVMARASAYADTVIASVAGMNGLQDVLDRHDIERAFQLGFVAGFEVGKVSGFNSARGVGKR